MDECERHGVELVFVTESLDNTDEGKLLMHVKGYAAKLDRARILDNTKRGRKERARKGKLPHWAGRLYGYDYIPGRGEGQGIRIVTEEQAEVVRQIFGWCVEEQMTLYSICTRLLDLQVPPPLGSRQWRPSGVRSILANEVYTGRTYAYKYRTEYQTGKDGRQTKVRRLRSLEEWIELPGVTPRIIDDDAFASAQERLRRNQELSSRNQQRDYLLSGFLFCGWCGRRYQGTTRGANDRWASYRCSAKQRVVSVEGCPSPYLNAIEAEQAVWDRVREALLHPKMLLAAMKAGHEEVGDEQHQKERVVQLERRLGRLDRDEARLIRLYRLGEFDDEAIEREAKALRTERERLRGELVRLSALQNETGAFEANLASVEAACALAAANLDSFTYEERRRTLEALQVRVFVRAEGLEVQGVLPVDIVMEPSR